MIKAKVLLAILAFALVATVASTARAQEVLPKPEPASKGAANVLLILADDVGFIASPAFGGPTPAPNFDTLATAGLRYKTLK